MNVHESHSRLAFQLAESIRAKNDNRLTADEFRIKAESLYAEAEKSGIDARELFQQGNAICNESEWEFGNELQMTVDFQAPLTPGERCAPRFQLPLPPGSPQPQLKMRLDDALNSRSWEPVPYPVLVNEVWQVEQSLTLSDRNGRFTPGVYSIDVLATVTTSLTESRTEQFVGRLKLKMLGNQKNPERKLSLIVGEDGLADLDLDLAQFHNVTVQIKKGATLRQEKDSVLDIARYLSTDDSAESHPKPFCEVVSLHRLPPGTPEPAWFTPRQVRPRPRTAQKHGGAAAQGVNYSVELTFEMAGNSFRLKLTGRDITDQSLNCLHQFPEVKRQSQAERIGELRGLRVLALTNASITDRALETVGCLTGIEVLHLGRTNISDRGVQHLRSLNQLKRLDLMHTSITDRCLKTLMQFPALKHLNVEGTNLSEEAVKQFKKHKAISVEFDG